MLTSNELEQLLFIDIETARICEKYDELSPVLQKYWERKVDKMSKNYDGDYELAFYENAGLYAEFAKIVCISCGLVQFNVDGTPNYIFKSYCNFDERLLLNEFIEMLGNLKRRKFCGHNIKNFDIPFICRRLCINNIELPPILNLHSKKPWEFPFVDTMDLWKFSEYNNYTSLELIAEVLGIPSPKDDISGSMVSKIFWEDGDLNRIKEYCQKDVLTTIKILLKISNHGNLFNN